MSLSTSLSLLRVSSFFPLALLATIASTPITGCASSEEENSRSENELATSRAEWKPRRTLGAGGPQRGLDWKCVPEGSSSRFLCSAGGTDLWTTASSITPAPTYTLVGATYLQVAAAGASPHGRRWFSLASFPAQNKVILFGGMRRPGVFCNDTWTWDGNAWREESPAHAPPPRQGATLVEDPVSKHILLFGGRDDTTTLEDLWEWDGADWTERTVRGSYPGSREAQNLGLLASAIAPRGEVLTVDPYTGLAWTYVNGAFNKHLEATPMRGNPAYGGGAMIYDERRNTIQQFLPDRTVYEGTFDATGALSWKHLDVAGNMSQGSFTNALFDRAVGNAAVFRGTVVWDLNWLVVPNRPPVVRPSQNSIQGFAGETMTFTASVEDPDDAPEALSIRVSGLPSGATWNARTRTFQWTPSLNQKGKYTVFLDATDGALRTAKVPVKLEVLWHSYAMLPTGSIDFLTSGVYGDSFTQWNSPDRRMLRGLFDLPAVYEAKGRDGYFHQEAFPWPLTTPIVSCRFTGTNPGKVTAFCISNKEGAQGHFGSWSRVVAENGTFPNGRLVSVQGEGPAMVASGYEAYLNSASRIRQTAAVTSLLRPMPTR